MDTTEYRAKVTQSEFEALSKYLAKSNCSYFVEIGTKHGGTVGLLSKRFPDIVFLTVDIRRGTGGDVKENDNVITIIGESSTVGSQLKDILKPRVGLLFLDGHHEINQLWRDLNAWTEALGKRGFVAVHDAVKHNKTPEIEKSRTPAIDGTHQIRQQRGPKRAVREFQENGWKLVDTVHSTAFLKKGKK